MKKNIFLIITLALITLVSCQEKKVKEVPKEVPVIQEVIKHEKVVVTEKPDNKEAEKIPVRGVNLKDRFFVVAGSYNIFSNASILKDQLLKLGYKPVILMQDENGQFKVTIESFQSLKQAEKELTKLTDKSNILKHSWIFKRKGKVEAFHKDPI
ncbi:SPOR domain-containing protein [Halosquirtibacter laminarini]|uniref:SPOR domain-containing protein n=1 Tax=Halosquirtibacter laminarini TaxID=3374600 RepID=A0AC61NEP9_9BACT|nr:SPOR domain-containing protein [Prolixibacteraceae bacterium]